MSRGVIFVRKASYAYSDLAYEPYLENGCTLLVEVFFQVMSNKDSKVMLSQGSAVSRRLALRLRRDTSCFPSVVHDYCNNFTTVDSMVHPRRMPFTHRNG